MDDKNLEGISTFQNEPMAVDSNGRVGKRKASVSGAVIVVATLSVIFLLLVFLAVIMAVSEDTSQKLEKEVNEQIEIQKDEKKKSLDLYEDSLHDLISWNQEFFAFNEFTELEDDPYDHAEEDYEYYVFDDYITTDVPYRVSLDTWVYSNEDGYYDDDEYRYPDKIIGYGEYLKLTDTGLANEDDINYELYYRSTAGMSLWNYGQYDISDDLVFFVESYPYVAYMDDDVISIIFEYTGWVVENFDEDDEEDTLKYSYVDAINIDLKTGKFIEGKYYVEPDDDFVEDFFANCMIQFEVELTGDDRDSFEAYFRENGVQFFYTPLGVEYIYNAPDYTYFYTVTSSDVIP